MRLAECRSPEIHRPVATFASGNAPGARNLARSQGPRASSLVTSKRLSPHSPSRTHASAYKCGKPSSSAPTPFVVSSSPTPYTMSKAASRSVIRRLINATQHTACPCHGCRTGGAHNPVQALQQMRRYATPVETLPVEKEYAFEVRNVHRQLWRENLTVRIRLLRLTFASERVSLAKSAWTSRT